MSRVDRNKLKDEVRAVAEGHGAGIDLDTPSHWAVDGVKDPIEFFQHLPSLMAAGSVLYAEGTSIAPELSAFYVSNQVRSAVRVARDTIFPAPDIYHFKFSAMVASRLRELAAIHPANE